MNVSAQPKMVNLPFPAQSTCSTARNALHDEVALALDAISGPQLSELNLTEARTYLRTALRLIGGAA